MYGNVILARRQCPMDRGTGTQHPLEQTCGQECWQSALAKAEVEAKRGFGANGE